MQTHRLASLRHPTWATWPPELRPLAASTCRRADALEQLAGLVLAHGTPQERAGFLEHLGTRTFGPSRALDRLLAVIRGFTEPEAAAVADGLARRTRYRGLRPQDRSLPVFDRMELWAEEAEQAFGDLSDASPSRARQLVRIAEDLCGLSTPADWVDAHEGLVAANYHDLAEHVAKEAGRRGIVVG